MADPQAVIADAFEKLKRSISEEDAHSFASTELEDVRAAVCEVDKIQRKRSSAQCMRRIEPFVRGIEKYAKVIEVLCNGTPFLPYVWAPIKLMLQIASNYRDVFNALLSAYTDIGAALPRFDRYNKAFSDNLEFQQALAAVYTGILDFHRRSYKFFRRRAWHVIFLSLWKDFGARFDGIIDSLKKQRDFIDSEAVSFDIVEGKESRARVQEEIQRKQKQELEMIKEAERNAKISQLQHTTAWLSTEEKFQEAEYERTSKRRHNRTCEWVSKEPQLKSWIKNDEKQPCLWLNGKPGSGKSVMCSYIIQTLTSTPHLTACFYFCNSQSSENICQQILTIIILQVLRQNPEVCTLIANEFVYRGVSCGMGQLRILVPQLLEVIGFTRIVVDGIDECSKESQKSILKELQTLCTGSTTHCKVLFSSRLEVHIRGKLSKKPQISLDGCQEVNWDIQSLVRYKITKLRTSNQELLEKIESTLVEKANGMFLWVRLVVDELKYCYSDAALEETVTSLPKGLKAAYGRILDRIMDPNNAKNGRYMAIRILGWMACSFRVLKSYEILDGVAFDASNTALTSQTKVRKEVLDLCRPLIEEGPAGTVDFVHFSAKEYILNETYQLERPFIWSENAHLDISFSSIALLNSSLPLLPDSSTEAQRASIIVQGFHGLHVYADTFWTRHLLAYSALLVQHRRQFSTELVDQLRLLLRFRKDCSQAYIETSKSTVDKNAEEYSALEALDHLPEIKKLVSDVVEFRTKMCRDDASSDTSESITLKSCDRDPTHFSAVRHHYLQTVESLLGDEASVAFPTISMKDLEEFRDTYSASAFVCRYEHCVFSTDGFESSSQRSKHESQHQRRFRCAHPSCIHFSTGFATKNQLNRHNELYHPAIVEGLSLAESLALSQSKFPTTLNIPNSIDFQLKLPVLDEAHNKSLMNARKEHDVMGTEDNSFAKNTRLPLPVSSNKDQLDYEMFTALEEQNTAVTKYSSNIDFGPEGRQDFDFDKFLDEEGSPFSLEKTVEQNAIVTKDFNNIDSSLEDFDFDAFLGGAGSPFSWEKVVEQNAVGTKDSKNIDSSLEDFDFDKFLNEGSPSFSLEKTVEQNAIATKDSNNIDSSLEDFDFDAFLGGAGSPFSFEEVVGSNKVGS